MANINQMLKQMHDGHAEILESIQSKRPVENWDFHCHGKSHRSLVRWGAFAGGELSSLGLELLAKYKRRKAASC